MFEFFPVKIEQVEGEEYGVSEIKRPAEEGRGSFCSTWPSSSLFPGIVFLC